MKPFAISLLMLLISLTLLAATGEDRRGVWTADLEEGRLRITISDARDHDSRHGWGSMMTFTVPVAKLEGFSAGNDVKFALRAPAGTIAFQGYFSGSEGAGHLLFTPDPAFLAEMHRLGYDDFNESTLFVFAAHDFAPETIRQLRGMGYEISKRTLEEIAVFSVTPSVIHEYERMGWPRPAMRDVISLRVGNVDAAYVEALRSLGYKDLSARDTAEMAILGVTPEWIHSLRSAGLTDVPARELHELRVGNITPEKIAGYRAAGYANLSPRQLAEFGIQGVTPEYIESLRKAGYDKLEPKQIEEMRIFGITPEFIHQMNAIGVTDLRKIIDLRATGAADILLKRK